MIVRRPTKFRESIDLPFFHLYLQLNEKRVSSQYDPDQMDQACFPDRPPVIIVRLLDAQHAARAGGVDSAGGNCLSASQ